MCPKCGHKHETLSLWMDLREPGTLGQRISREQWIGHAGGKSAEGRADTHRCFPSGAHLASTPTARQASQHDFKAASRCSYCCQRSGPQAPRHKGQTGKIRAQEKETGFGEYRRVSAGTRGVDQNAESDPVQQRRAGRVGGRSRPACQAIPRR